MVSLLSVTTPVYVIAKGSASKEKVIFVLKLLGPILPAYFHRFHKRISKKLRQNPPESLLWSTKS